jgi:DNA-binding NtrC family response regulator
VGASGERVDVTRTLTSGPDAAAPPEAVRVIVAYSPDASTIGAMRVVSASPVVVGRTGGDAGLALPDPRISREHAALELQGGRPLVRDLGSRNGTFVGGERISGERALADQDVVRIGDHCLVVQALAGDEVRRAVDAPAKMEALVGDGRAMRTLREAIAVAAGGTVPVLLLGETGTGKELVASEIHRLSQRKGAFVPLNCAAIPEHLAEGELFGYVRGAFTGAVDDSHGLFRAAEGGTLLLDEIGEMPLALQAKLLRALATGEVRRVGETASRRVDVRIVAATNVDLETAAREQRFRADLLARLAGHVVRVPALRERREDVLALAAHFLARALDLRSGSAAELLAKCVAPDAAESLLAHAWPFNVRGLEQTIRVAAAHLERSESARLEAAHLGAAFRASMESRLGGAPAPSPLAKILEIRPDAVPTADELRSVIAHFGGNVTRVAAFFGKERRQIYRWAEKHDIDLGEARDE